MRSIRALLILFLLYPACSTQEADQQHRCDGCERIFYELRFDLSLPCHRNGGDTQNLLQAACFQHPDTNDPFNTTSYEEESESVSFIRSLQLLELDSLYGIQAQASFDGHWETGFSLLYESVAPPLSKGLQVMAIGLGANSNQEESRRSWSIHFGENCVEDHIRESVGWAEMVSALDQDA